MAVGAISPTDDKAPHEVRSSIICLNTTLYMCKDMHFNYVHDFVPGRWSSAIISYITGTGCVAFIVLKPEGVKRPEGRVL